MKWPQLYIRYFNNTQLSCCQAVLIIKTNHCPEKPRLGRSNAPKRVCKRSSVAIGALDNHGMTSCRQNIPQKTGYKQCRGLLIPQTRTTVACQSTQTNLNAQQGNFPLVSLVGILFISRYDQHLAANHNTSLRQSVFQVNLCDCSI